MTSELLVFGEDWGRHPSSTQHLINHLRHQFDVQWVNSIGLRAPSLSAKDFKRINDKLMQWWQPAIPGTEAQMRPPRKLIKPMVLPFHSSPCARWLNRKLFSYQLHKVAGNKQQRRVVWLSLPTAVTLLDVCDSDFVIYYVGDDFTALSGVDHQQAAVMEAELIERADLIVAVSDSLLARMPKDKCRVLPHGVDWDLFAKPKPKAPALEGLENTVGFYGNIASWVDLKLIREMALARPQYTFCMVGPVNTDISLIEGIDNIRLLPEVSHQALPGYSQHWDVSILPFVQNAQIQACNPLKLREYLAAGSPIVTTEFPALKPYRHLMYVATAQTFLHRIDFAMCLNALQKQDLKSRMQGTVMHESWEYRARQLKAWLE